MNFTLMTGTVNKATRYFSELSLAEQVRQTILLIS